jgi:hypothetical protein
MSRATLPMPGLLLIRAALSQQPSNHSLTLRLKRSCQMSRLAHGPSRLRTFQASAPLKPPGGAVEPLARIDYFDFDDPAFAAAYGINGMHADRAIIDKPRHH